VQRSGIVVAPGGGVAVALEVEGGKPAASPGEFHRHLEHALLDAEFGCEQADTLRHLGRQGPQDKGEQDHQLHDS